jgi:hypothetical protein
MVSFFVDTSVNLVKLSGLPCCFLAAILYLIQDSSKEAAGKTIEINRV